MAGPIARASDERRFDGVTRGPSGFGAPRPEMRLLVVCARSELGDDDRTRLRRLVHADGLDWEAVWEAGEYHGLLPLLCHHLEAAVPDRVPETIGERLRSRHETRAHRNLYLTFRLLEILGELDDHGVRAIPLKGPVLAHRLYSDPSLREYSDLDILVPPDRMREARQGLASLGFLSRRGRSRGQEAAFRRAMHAEVFFRPHDEVVVDLHWDLAPAYQSTALKLDVLWGGTQNVPVGGADVRVFSDETTLLLLCLHGGRVIPFPWSRIRWLCDIAELVRGRPELDWDGVRSMANVSGCRRMLELGLWLATELLEAPLPDEMERCVRSDPRVAEIGHRVGRRLLEGERDPPPAISRMWIDLQLRERLRDKVSIALRQTFAPRLQDWEVARLPRVLAPLYFPIRLGRLILKFLFPGPARTWTHRFRGRENRGFR